MKYLYIIIVILFVLLLISILYSYFKIDINSFLIKSKKIDKNIKIMFLSDLHNRNISSKIIKIINNEHPDFIVLGGDMVNEHIKSTDNFLKLVEMIDNNKLFYVYGNHEESMSVVDKNEYFKKINFTNVILLNNDSVRLSSNVRLCGLDSEINCYKYNGELGLNKEYITSKIGEIDNYVFNILIAHNPLEFDSYVDYGCDLVLSGHIHGGIVRIPFVGGLLSPDYSLFPKYYQGKYTKNNTSMIVSRGLGFSKIIPYRVNNPGEVVIINLEHDEE